MRICVYNVQYIKYINHSVFSVPGAKHWNCKLLDPGILPNKRATLKSYHYSPLSPSFYFNESTINKEMERLPKGGRFLHNGSLLLSMAVLNSPTRPLGHIEGHLQYRPTPHPLTTTTTLFLAPSLSLILKVSRANLCHGII